MNGALVTGPGARTVTGALVPPPPPVKGALVPSARDSIAATMRRTGPSGTFTGPLPPKAYAQEVLADAPALYWRCDEPAAAPTLADASGNGHAGTSSGVGVTLGLPSPVSGTGLAFTTPGYVSTPNFPALNAPPLTIELWYDMAGNTLTAYDLLYFSGDTGNWDNGIGCYFNGGNLYWFVGHYATGVVTVPTANASSGIHHYVWTLAPNGDAIVYRDGAQVATANRAGNLAAMPATTAFEFGVGSFGSTAAGTYDEFAVYAAVLPPDRVAAHYAAKGHN